MTLKPILLTSKDRAWLALAREVSCYSNDPYTKVGCVLVNEDNHLVSAGFNHLPGGFDPNSLTREQKNRLAIHAEEHALGFKRTFEECTAYLWPVEPCYDCAVKLSSAGLGRVIAPIDDNSEVYRRWHGNLMKSRNHLDFKCVHRVYTPMDSSLKTISSVDKDELNFLAEKVRQLWLK